jgi:hypothetical protein
MSRYRRELTHPEQSVAAMVEQLRRLRQELQSMVSRRRRSDHVLSDGLVGKAVELKRNRASRRKGGGRKS